ncbi:hypothetical protein K6V33_01520 [Streptococcus suis]|nr:hypothetical protein [Streptococcus suis]
MKKKLFLLMTALVTFFALTACSSEPFVLKDTEVTYMTDEEIAAIQTFGDYKNAMKSLSDSYVADFNELVEQLPEDYQEAIKEEAGDLEQLMADQQAALEESMADIPDTEAIPVESKESMLSTLKTMRDQLKSTMQDIRDSAVEELNQ